MTRTRSVLLFRLFLWLIVILVGTDLSISRGFAQSKQWKDVWTSTFGEVEPKANVVFSPLKPDCNRSDGLQIGRAGMPPLANDTETSEVVEISSGPTVATFGLATNSVSQDTLTGLYPCQEEIYDSEQEQIPPVPPEVDEFDTSVSESILNLKSEENLGPISFTDRALESAPTLDCGFPFCGRDIILVHGFRTTPFANFFIDKDPASSSKWPRDAAAFSGAGKSNNTDVASANFDALPHPWDFAPFDWKTGAEIYWYAYLKNKLLPAYGATNATRNVSRFPRVLVVAWPSTQRLEVAQHAFLSQVSEAIKSGKDVSIFAPRPFGGADSPPMYYDLSTLPKLSDGFCSRKCVVISHSAGGPLVSSSLALAERGFQTGPSILTPQWMTPAFKSLKSRIAAHVAFAPAYGGSRAASAAIATGMGCADSNVILCSQFVKFRERSTGQATSSGEAAAMALHAPYILGTVAVDLVPKVTDALWRPNFDWNPVPTLILTHAHPRQTGSLLFLMEGFDDGVVTVDGQLGRPTSFSGKSNHVDTHLMGRFDKAATKWVAAYHFYNQFLQSNPIFAGKAHANWQLTPTGMQLRNVKPSADPSPVPVLSAGLKNHYSFVASEASHFFPRSVGQKDADGVKESPAGCSANSFDYSNTKDEERVRVETFAIMDASLFGIEVVDQLTPIGQSTRVQKLVSPSILSAIETTLIRKYLSIKIPLVRKPIKLLVWRRVYQRLAGWECEDEIDDLHRYVLRN